MKEALKNYLKELEDNKNIDEEKLLKNIEIFQHERLIHLIVTVFVGISTLILFGLGLIIENILLLLLSLITLVLFSFYIFHYYFLENSVQKLYTYYWDKKKSSK